MGATAVTVEQYVNSSWRPDREYANGEVLERNVGEKEHSLLQAFLTSWFFQHRREVEHYRAAGAARAGRRWNMAGARPDAGPARPDSERWVKTAPLLCVEILSPEHRMDRIEPRLEDYRKMGVANVWALEPVGRTAWTYSADGLAAVSGARLQVMGSPVYLPVAELWAELDQEC